VPGRTRIALIVDNLSIRQWQANSLLQLDDDAEFILLNCTNTRFTRKLFGHGLYYLLNLLSLKTPSSRPVPLPAALNIVERYDFAAEWDGAWQRFPPAVLDLLTARRPAVAIKFGMGLLRVPDQLECRILSYHHGDPRRFRGRPAGFYELLENVATVGQIVQIISNQLDAGAIVAFAETRVQPHSYRATMAESYRTSPLLLSRALRNCLSGHVLPIPPEGRNCRLPSNLTVLRFAGKLLIEKVRRLTYGALFEKAWEVASARADTRSPERLIEAIGQPGDWQTVHRPRNYRFLADPFPHPRGGVIVEALRRSDGQGEIIHFKDEVARILCTGPGHFSYPATVSAGGDWFMVPEVSEWTRPRIYRLTEQGCEYAAELDVEGAPRLVDATLHPGADGVYLFANDAAEGSEVLRLWTADSLFSRFTEHPDSPVLISPAGGRMAGTLVEIGGQLCRLGQDCSRGYGRRIILFEVLEISRASYAERPADGLSLGGVTGPHTLNLQGGTAYFDFYRERFSPLAGLRRVRAALSKRRALSAAQGAGSETVHLSR
jgi:hypothetical protein